MDGQIERHCADVLRIGIISEMQMNVSPRRYAHRLGLDVQIYMSALEGCWADMQIGGGLIRIIDIKLVWAQGFRCRVCCWDEWRW